MLAKFIASLLGTRRSGRSLERYRRLDDFIARRLEEDLYPERSDPGHSEVTRRMIEHISSRWPLAGKRVLDVGCGQGLALERFVALGAVPTGLTFGADLEACRRRGFDVIAMDMSFLEFPDASFDLIWARHALEHSLFPFLTLTCCPQTRWSALCRSSGTRHQRAPPDESQSLFLSDA